MFDLITAVILGKLPHQRLTIHLCLIGIGFVGAAANFFCICYGVSNLDYVILLGFAAIGISTCFQPMLMLCNVDDLKLTSINAAVFAVFKQLSWAATYVISYWVYESHGFKGILVFSFIALSLLSIFTILAKHVDPFQKSVDEGYESLENSRKSSNNVSEHLSESSPLLKSPEPGTSAIGYAEISPSVLRVEDLHSGCYDYVVMFLTGAFTFESAVHCTALQYLFQMKWNFR